MSGGAYEDAYYKINKIVIENIDIDPKRYKFSVLLQLVAEAMHDIEWVDSGDYSPGDEYKAIDNCFEFIKELK